MLHDLGGEHPRVVRTDEGDRHGFERKVDDRLVPGPITDVSVVAHRPGRLADQPDPARFSAAVLVAIDSLACPARELVAGPRRRLVPLLDGEQCDFLRFPAEGRSQVVYVAGLNGDERGLRTGDPSSTSGSVTSMNS